MDIVLKTNCTSKVAASELFVKRSMHGSERSVLITGMTTEKTVKNTEDDGCDRKCGQGRNLGGRGNGPSDFGPDPKKG